MKRPNRLLAVLAACLLLAGCAAGAPQPNSAPARSEPGAESSTSQPAARPAGSGTLHMATASSGIGSLAAAENGFYTLETGENGRCTLRFLDYGSNHQTCLCAVPGCGHDSDSCTAFVDTSSGPAPCLLFEGRRLYLIYPTSADGDIPARVEVMEPDGSGRRELARFDSGQQPSLGQFAADDTCLYFVAEQTQPDGSLTRSLWAMDKADGSLRTLLEIPQGSSFWLLGAFDRSLLVKTIDDRNLHHLSRLDVDSPAAPQELVSWKLSQQYGIVEGSCLYCYNYDRQCFTRQDFATGSTDELANTAGLPFEDLSNVCVIDGKVILQASLNGGGTSRVSNFCLDFETGRLAELGLLDNMGRPVVICGASGEDVYVIDQYASWSAQETFGGMVSTVERSAPRYARIAKADFFAGTPSYTPCESAA